MEGKVKGVYKNSYTILMTLPRLKADPKPILEIRQMLPDQFMESGSLLPCHASEMADFKGYGVGVGSGSMTSGSSVGSEALLTSNEQMVRTTVISAAMFGSWMYSEASIMEAISNA